MQKTIRLYLTLILAVFLTGLSQWKLQKNFKWPFPPINQLVVTNQYMTDLGAIFLGARRLAADIAYIQFLQYYGTQEKDHDSDENKILIGKVLVHDHTAGHYLLNLEFGQRILHIDPYFHSGISSIAVALAYNQRRIEEGLKLLRDAIELDPSFFRYRIYIGAILFKNQGKDLEMASLLEEAVSYKDCPFMLKNILANLYKKLNLWDKALPVYLNMVTTTASPGDRKFAEEKLESLLQDHPELRAKIPNFDLK